MNADYINKYLLRQDNNLSIIEESIELKNNEILLKVTYAGICGTDLDIMRDARPDRAKVIGHEGIATVSALGNTVNGYDIGEKIVFNPVNPDDQDDILGHSREGIFQRYFKYSLTDKNKSLIHKIDTSLDDRYGALIEPLGTAIYGNTLVNSVVKQNTIVIVGAGPIGLVNALFAKSQGSKVILVNKSKDRLKFAVDKGIIDKEYAIEDSPELTKVLQREFGIIDAVYLCANRAGTLEALTKSVEYIKDNGCINMVGGIQNGDRLPFINYPDLNQIRRNNACMTGKFYVPSVKVYGKKLVYFTGHRGTSPSHLDKAISILKMDYDNYSRIITHSVTLEEVPALMSDVLSNRLNNSYVKGVINLLN